MLTLSKADAFFKVHPLHPHNHRQAEVAIGLKFQERWSV